MTDTAATAAAVMVDMPYLVDAVREWTEPHIQPGRAVFDRDGIALGEVAHVHEGPVRAGSAALESCVEVRTGPLGLGAHLYVPFTAVSDVTAGGVFLKAPRGRRPLDDWNTRPATLDAAPAPEDPGPPAVDAGDWETARDAYWRHWAARYGREGLAWAEWERFEPRYRFVWLMGHQSPYAVRPWHAVEGDLRTAWEALHPNDEWDEAAELIRDAWELRRDELADWLAA